MDEVTGALVAAFQTCRGSLEDPIEPGAIDDVLATLPVVVRAALAAIALSAVDRSVNAMTLAQSGRFSRGTSYRGNREAIAAIVQGAPNLTAHLLGRAVASEPFNGAAAAEIRARDATIASLRAKLKEADADRHLALSYARDLHEQLVPEYERILREKSTKVRHLRPLEPDLPSE